MKKRLSIIISFLMIFSLFGCNKEEAPKPDENTFDENVLLEELEANSYFLEDGDTLLYVRFNKQQRSYEELIKASGYYLKAEISKIEKLEDNKYLLTLHIPAFAGNEMTDPYDAYDVFYTIKYDLNKPAEYDCTIESEDHSVSRNYHYRSDKGLSNEELLKLLEKNSWYYDEYQGYFCKFDAARKSYQETISQTSYFLEAEINEIKYLGMGSYQMTMHVPAFAGNEESDPHEAYDLIYTIDIYESDPSLFTCTVESSDHVSINSFFYESDKGLSLDELLKQLEANGDFFCETLGTIGSFNATEKTYEEMMDATSYYLKAAITDFRYLQAKQYELTLHVDGFEGNEMTDPYDPYDIIMVLTYDTLKPKEYDAVMAYPASDYSLSGHFVSRQ
ncbi:MAG: hypothetical protein IK151_04350 [Erysipelotrichaceae bacterium]|nr:hypothetical protein [Erysipelotrichaceae bacterium]